MSLPPLDLESLRAPLADAEPSGPDLVYDPEFAELEQAGAGKPERQYGDKVYPAEPADWMAVREHAMALSVRTRDLRVALWLARCGARMDGLSGFTQGLQLVHGLMSQLWDSVHPQLDSSDNNDPTMRLNALAPFTASDAALADLRAASIAPVRGSLTLRHLELGLGKADAGADETTPTEAGVLEALAALLREHADVAGRAQAAHDTAVQIASLLETRVGAAAAPDLAPLIKLLALLKDAVARVGGGAAIAGAPTQDSGDAGHSGGANGAGVATGAIRSRSDAVRELERICGWIEQNEPSNPAPLLIRRAQRLMDKSFLDIIRDLAPDGLVQVERLAGTDTSN
jgi:type VI secretion system protein ImpA